MDQFTVVGGSQKDIRTFYSTLYRLLLFPHNIPESGRYMSPYDGKVHAGQMFTDVGFWDVARATQPFLTLFYPDVSELMVDGMLDTFVQSGHLPRWASPNHRNTMVGNHAD